MNPSFARRYFDLCARRYAVLYVRLSFAALAVAVNLLICVPGAAAADAVANAIKGGGVVLLLRHATAPGFGDPEKFDVDDCSTQRNLSADGRKEAKRVGARLKALGLQPGAIYASQWCRCRETAELAFGWTQSKAKDWPALNSFFRNRDSETRQMDEVRARIATIKRGDKPLVLVTHQVVITSLTGVFAESGEVIVVAPESNAGGASAAARTGHAGSGNKSSGAASGSAARPGLRVIGTIKPGAAT